MQELESQLLELGYRDLFLRQTDENLEQIWNQPDAPEKLLSLAQDATGKPEVRLLAFEILLHKKAVHVGSQDYGNIVQVYCHALETNKTGNLWALPGYFVGKLGKHLLRFGTDALDPLITLLDVETPIQYQGSETATVGNRLKLRVKDLAAFFIAQIKMIPLVLDADPTVRDTAIAKLAQDL